MWNRQHSDTLQQTIFATLTAMRTKNLAECILRKIKSSDVSIYYIESILDATEKHPLWNRWYLTPSSSQQWFWYLRYSGILCSLRWQILTDVSGQRIGPIFKGQENRFLERVKKSDFLTAEEGTHCPEASVSNCHLRLRNIPEDRRSHRLRGGSLKSCEQCFFFWLEME